MDKRDEIVDQMIHTKNVIHSLYLLIYMFAIFIATLCIINVHPVIEELVKNSIFLKLNIAFFISMMCHGIINILAIFKKNIVYMKLLLKDKQDYDKNNNKLAEINKLERNNNRLFVYMWIHITAILFVMAL